MRGRQWTAALLILAACSGEAVTSPPSASLRPQPSAPSAPIEARADGVQTCWTAPTGPGKGSISFSDKTDAAGLIKPLLGMRGHALAWGDVDRDGWLDLFVGTFANRPDDDYQQRGAPGPSPDRLLRGGPKGFKVDESFPGGRSRSSGAAFADLDGDGDADLVVARNSVSRHADLPGTVILRNDKGAFRPAAKLVPGLGARSVGVLDYDGDGRLDLFIAEDRFTGGSSRLLRNQGEFQFADVTGKAGLPSDVHGLGVATADLTGDGWTDLFVAGSNRLFVNDGNGSFREADASVFVWEAYGKEDDVAGVAVGDLNRDGRPDLVLGHHYNSTLDKGREVPIRLYLHRGTDPQGQPRFEDVTGEAGLPGLATKAPGVEIADFDNDGWPDILTTASVGDGGRPALFRHTGLVKGVPRFSRLERPMNDHYWVTGASADSDHDGRLDVALVEWEPALPSVLLRNQSPGGHWLEVQVAGAPTMGAVVEIHRPGGGELVGRQEVSASHSYGAGSAPAAHFGLGEITKVDVVVKLPRGGKVTQFPGVSADQHVQVLGACAKAPS